MFGGLTAREGSYGFPELGLCLFVYIHVLDRKMVRGFSMAHKTLTISEEAYNALAKQRKSEDESFTKVILRLAKKDEDDSAGRLLEYIRSMPPADELADKLEEV